MAKTRSFQDSAPQSPTTQWTPLSTFCKQFDIFFCVCVLLIMSNLCIFKFIFDNILSICVYFSTYLQPFGKDSYPEGGVEEEGQEGG